MIIPLFSSILISSVLSAASGHGAADCGFPVSAPADSVRTDISWPELLPDDAMPDKNCYTVAIVGDIMMGTTFPETRLPSYGGTRLFEDCRDILLRADIAAGNLEGVLCEGGESTKKVVEGRSYAFRMPREYVKLLDDAGFDFMSIANNHTRDFGNHGMSSTMHLLDSAGIGYAGLPECGFAVRKSGGLTFGFCAFGHNSHTLNHTDSSTVRRIVSSARAGCDILIVSFHGGAEGAEMSHLPYGRETYLGEDRGNLRELAHMCVDLGADIVFGHGPHVTRGIEVYRDKFIAYSLGNFCTPYGINIGGINGYAPLMEIRISRDGKFRSGTIHSFIQYPGTGPRRDPTGIVASHIARLTEEDFENPGVSIGADGTVRPFGLPSGLPANANLISGEKRNGYGCFLAEYEVPDGDTVQAFLLVPDGASAENPCPGIVMLHDHGARFDIGKEKLARPLPDAPYNIIRSSQQWVGKNFDGVYFADSLASLGYAVIVPDMLYWGSRCSEACRQWSRTEFGQGAAVAQDMSSDLADSLKKTVYEGQKAVYDSLYADGVVWAEKTLEEDACAARLLKGLDCVDDDKVAAFGWSMGAHRAWMLAGFSEDVTTGVSVGWMTLKHTQAKPCKASDYAMLVPELREKYDFPDIARKLVPKPCLFISGLEDRLFPAPVVEQAFSMMQDIYSENGAGGLLQTEFTGGPHHCGKAVQERIAGFLEKIFAGQ